MRSSVATTFAATTEYVERFSSLTKLVSVTAYMQCFFFYSSHYPNEK